MPKTKFQNVVFTLMMSFLMVYAMICYNISMNIGGMTNQVFLMAFHEMMIMWPAAFILEFFLLEWFIGLLCAFFIANKTSKYFAFRVAKSTDRPIFIILCIQTFTVCTMVPLHIPSPVRFHQPRK